MNLLSVIFKEDKTDFLPAVKPGGYTSRLPHGVPQCSTKLLQEKTRPPRKAFTLVFLFFAWCEDDIQFCRYCTLISLTAASVAVSSSLVSNDCLLQSPSAFITKTRKLIGFGIPRTTERARCDDPAALQRHDKSTMVRKQEKVYFYKKLYKVRWKILVHIALYPQLSEIGKYHDAEQK